VRATLLSEDKYPKIHKGGAHSPPRSGSFYHKRIRDTSGIMYPEMQEREIRLYPFLGMMEKINNA
jgi:hypothetical protein